MVVGQEEINSVRTLVFVTGNLDKVEDAKKLLPEFKIEHIDFDIPEIQSHYLPDVVEKKATFAYEKVKKPLFVMDTGLFLDALNGFPGPFIRWFFETVGSEKICRIANTLKDPNCHWTTILAYHDGLKIRYLEENVVGTIPERPRGSGGYAWDNIVIPKGSKKTFAEMTFEEKQSFAVTKKLMDKFKELL
jgi:non-canonical purine NTP pyrophosphatase (RdgB/HAM1 family)